MASKKGSSKGKKGGKAERVRKAPAPKGQQPKAAKNGKPNGKPVKSPPPAPKPKPRKEPVKRSETIVKKPPSILLPSLIYIVVLIACYILGNYDLVTSYIIYPVFAFASFAIVGYIIIVMRWDHMKSKRGVQFFCVWLALTFLAMALPLKSAIFYGEPVAEARLTSGNRTFSFDPTDHGRRFMVLLEGNFTKLDELTEEAIAQAKALEQESEEGEDGEEEKKKPVVSKTYDLTGNYVFKLRAADGTELDEFEGRFSAKGMKRRLSKKGRGYIATHNTITKQVIKVPAKSDKIELNLSFLDEELSKGIDVTVYEWANFPVLNYLLAILAMVVGSFIDFLLKQKRQAGWFTFGAGLLAGFGIYYLSEATPLTRVDIFVFDLIIGGIIGLVFAAIILYGMEPLLWTRLNRKLKINL